PSLFHIPPNLYREVRVVISIMGASVAMQFAFFPYSAVFTAVQRFDISNGIGISTRIVYVIATVLVLKMGFSLVGLSIVMAVSNLLDYLIRWRVARRLLPSLGVSVHLFSWRHLSEAAKFGIWNVAVAGGVRLISYTDALVIAAFLPISAVAPFAVA